MLRSTCSFILSVISLLLEVRSVFDEDALSIDEYIIAYLHVPVYEGCVHVGEHAKNRRLTPVDGGVRLSVSFFFTFDLNRLKAREQCHSGLSFKLNADCANVERC